jgi:hypothetical protein
MGKLAVVVVAVGTWVAAVGLFAAFGIALLAAVQKRLVLESRLFLWRQPKRVLEGREAIHASFTFMVLILMAAVLFLGIAVQTTPLLWRL